MTLLIGELIDSSKGRRPNRISFEKTKFRFKFQKKVTMCLVPIEENSEGCLNSTIFYSNPMWTLVIRNYHTPTSKK